MAFEQCGVVGILAFGAVSAYLDHYTFMNASQAEKRWGRKRFLVGAFNSGSVVERAAEAADLARHQTLVGKTADEVVDLVGSTSGFFWSDHFPTYFIEEGWTQKKDSWQLVFLLNSEDRVAEIRIHKNCCYAKFPWEFSGK